MSDARTRELERLTAEGDLGAEAELLVARMRAGTIARERIELLAYCGHPVAEQLAEVPPAADPLSWCAGLQARGGALAIELAACACARGGPLPELRLDPGGEPTLRKALEAVGLRRAQGELADRLLRDAHRQLSWRAMSLIQRVGASSHQGARLVAADHVALFARAFTLMSGVAACEASAPGVTNSSHATRNVGELEGASQLEWGGGRSLLQAIRSLAWARTGVNAATAKRVAQEPAAHQPAADALRSAWETARAGVITWASAPVRQSPQLDVARLQRARLSGRIDARDLSLAAYLGYEPALKAVRVEPPHELLRWIEELGEFGQEPLVRAALCLARQHLRARGKGSDAPEQALFAGVEAWLADPSREQARALLRQAEDLAEEVEVDPAAERAALAAGSSRKLDAQRYAVATARWLLAWRTCERAELSDLGRSTRELDRLLANPQRATPEALAKLSLERLPQDEPSLRGVVRDALVPAALAPLASELGL